MDAVSSASFASSFFAPSSSLTNPPPAAGVAGAGLLAPKSPSAAAAAATSTEPGKISAVFKPRLHRKSSFPSSIPSSSSSPRGAVKAALQELDVPRVTSNDPVDHQQGSSLLPGLESSEPEPMNSVGGFSPDPPFTFDLGAAAATGGAGSASEAQVLAASQAMYQPRVVWFATSEEEERQFLDRAINATLVGAAGAFAMTKVLTVDHDYWHGWTIFEILKYAPLHNWSAYEEALKNNPILAKMMISGIVYSLGDWIAQCYEGKPILDFSRDRMIRSGLVGFCLHGSLSHFYYHLCEALFPFKDWWVVPLKVVFDQTIWSAIWNSIYFVTLGLLRLESPFSIASELKSTFWPLLTAGWKLWPFAHLITYGVVPVEQRLLWVDCVELVWVTILSMYSNEKAEARILEAATEAAAMELSAGSRSDLGSQEESQGESH